MRVVCVLIFVSARKMVGSGVQVTVIADFDLLLTPKRQSDRTPAPVAGFSGDGVHHSAPKSGVQGDQPQQTAPSQPGQARCHTSTRKATDLLSRKVHQPGNGQNTRSNGQNRQGVFPCEFEPGTAEQARSQQWQIPG